MVHCLAWLSFLYYRFARFLFSTQKTFFCGAGCDQIKHEHATGLLTYSTPSNETGFATSRIALGDVIIAQVTSFQEVWRTSEGGVGNQSVAFFKPVDLPAGFHCLGYYSQPAKTSAKGWILVAKGNDYGSCVREQDNADTIPANGVPSLIGVYGSFQKSALARPVGYRLVWSSTEWNGRASGHGFFWLPTPPEGYKSLGFVVSNTEREPSTDEVMCIRDDLTEACNINDMIWQANTPSGFKVLNSMPVTNGTEAQGIPVGTFLCSVNSDNNGFVPIACLKNKMLSFSGMPSLEQVQILMSTYAPVIYFHPDEKYFPSSVSWLFNKGALLYTKGDSQPVLVSTDGSNLPVGGGDDEEYWIDLPSNGMAEQIEAGDLSAAVVYVHVKPMLGATFTDLAVWIYCPFNGAATAKVELVNVKLGRIGEHVSDWEHVTLRINNLTGKLYKVFFSQHSGGEWLDPADLEYFEGSRFIVYSSKHGHASYPHAGLYLQGDHGVGIRNDAAKSDFFLDTSKHYELISAEYLNSDGRVGLQEPHWLQYMRKWGPKVQYDSREELDNVLGKLPKFLRKKLRSLANKFPNEVFGEEGPTGPKEKPSWFGDEHV